MFNILGWVIWVIVLITSIMFLLNKEREGGTRYMMRIQGWVLICGLIATYSYLSKFNLIWVFVISLLIPMIVMTSRASRGMKRVDKLIKQSKESGEPLNELIKKELNK
jgi:general stress protein CsbA